MLRAKKYWFTLAEVVIACSIFAIVVVWIILAINRSFMFMNNIKLSVRAANFAREWVEMMYNIRDTNWREHSGQRDRLWLYLWKGDIPQSETQTSNDLFYPWIYFISEWEKNGNSYLYAEKIDVTNIEDFYSDSGFWDDAAKDKVKMKFENNQKYYYYDNNNAKQEWNIEDVLIWDWLEFYRIVRVYWIYCKNSNSSNDTASCPNPSDPKEMRFCVKVFYRWNWKHSSELCSIMTNFME